MLLSATLTPAVFSCYLGRVLCAGRTKKTKKTQQDLRQFQTIFKQHEILIKSTIKKDQDKITASELIIIITDLMFL